MNHGGGALQDKARQRFSRKSLIGASVAAVLAAETGRRAAARAVGYQIVELHAGIGDWSTALKINNRNQVLGIEGDPDNTIWNRVVNGRTILWEPEGVLDLGDYQLIDPVDLDDRGIVVSNTRDGSAPLLFDPATKTTTTLPTTGWAAAIDATGNVVGRNFDFPWLVSSQQVTALPIPDGFEALLPNAIASPSLIAATARHRLAPWPDDPQFAAVVANGALTLLPAAPGGASSRSTGVNSAGQVVGGPGRFGVHESTDSGRAWRFDIASGAQIDLGVTPGFLSSQASGINIGGQVVGMCFASESGNAPHNTAFVFDPGVNQIQSLNDLLNTNSGWYLENASDINDAGIIVGQGKLNGRTRGFLLVPA